MMAKVALWTCDYRFESGFSSKIAGSSENNQSEPLAVRTLLCYYIKV